MKTVIIKLTTFWLVMAAIRTFATDVEVNPAAGKNVALTEHKSSIPFEFDLEQTYEANGDVSRGNNSIQDFDGSDTKAQFVFTPLTKIGIIRIGIGGERYSFGYPSNGPIPDVLESTNLVIGLDTQLSDSILIRLEAKPGFYGTDWDDYGRDTFNVPAVLGGTYIFNSGFQIFFGVGIDFLRQYPVLPGGGVRWKLASQWTLNAVVPTPRLEYELNSSFMMYVGGDLRSTSYRVDKQFGTALGNTELNHAALTYNEVRIGAGCEWKLSSSIKLSFEGGFIPNREFDFHRTEVRYHQDDGVPYGMLSFHAAF